VVLDERDVVRTTHLVVPAPVERHHVDTGHPWGVGQIGQGPLHLAVPALGGEPGPPHQALQGGHRPGHRNGQFRRNLRVPLDVQLPAASELPVQQRPPDAGATQPGVHPTFQVYLAGSADGW
jgi:hypothetical protein